MNWCHGQPARFLSIKVGCLPAGLQYAALLTWVHLKLSTKGNGLSLHYKLSKQLWAIFFCMVFMHKWHWSPHFSQRYLIPWRGTHGILKIALNREIVTYGITPELFSRGTLSTVYSSMKLIFQGDLHNLCNIHFSFPWTVSYCQGNHDDKKFTDHGWSWNWQWDL